MTLYSKVLMVALLPLHPIEKLEERTQRDYWPLDRKLVPYMKEADTIEDASEKTWLEKKPEAMTDADERRPAVLAEEYHLNIRRERIADHSEEYILFFREGTLEVFKDPAPGEKHSPMTQTIKIPANTIVLNRCVRQRDDGDLAIYKACFQYEWHYLFYAYNSCTHTCLDQFEPKSISIEKAREEKDVRTLIRWEAEDGAIALMMPFSIIYEKIWREYQKAGDAPLLRGYANHQGFRYESAIRTIVDEYHLRPFRVKNRAIRLGFYGAKGALNFDPDMRRYFPAYALSGDYHKSCKSRPRDEVRRESFFITRKKLLQLYESNSDFRKVMSTGEFAYVDGLVCLNDPDFLRLLGGEWAMERNANATVDTCCIRFYREYTGSHYVYNFDVGRFKGHREIMRRHCSLTIQEKEDFKRKLLHSLPRSFPKALQYLMNNHPDGIRFTESTLAVKSSLPREVIHQYCTNNSQVYTQDEIVAICVGMNLPPWLSNRMMDKANLEVPRTGALAHYGMILDCLFRETVKEVQAFLDNNGLPILRIP